MRVWYKICPGPGSDAGMQNWLPIAQWASPLDGWFSRKNIFCQKIFDNFFSFQATEIILTSKCDRI